MTHPVYPFNFSFYYFSGGLTPQFQGIIRAPRQSSYGSPPSPSYSATPVAAAPPSPSGDSYGSPAAPPVGGGDSYGSSVAPPVGPPPAAPPTYGSSSNNCDVIRSLTRIGNDCQQGGQECASQCTTTQEQECTTEYEQVCQEINEQVSSNCLVRLG